MDMQVLDTRRDSSGGYKVDVSRGSRVGRVSSEWFSRPDDERFLSLGDLARSVRGRSERSRTRVVETALIHVEANRNDPERLALMLPGAEAPVTPTHWSFGQLASQVGAPAAYLRQLPAPLTAINLQYGLSRNLLGTLRERDLADAGTALSREHGIPYRQSRSSGEVSGVYRQRIQLASGRFAMIDDGLGFSLVPWSKQLDRHLGQYVSGQPRSGGGIEWTLGRSRSIEI